MPNKNITIKDLVDTAQSFNLNYFELDKRSQTQIKKYIKEKRLEEQQQQQPQIIKEEPKEEPPQPPKKYWQDYLKMASTELKNDENQSATLKNIQKRARELALNDGYEFKKPKV